MTTKILVVDDEPDIELLIRQKFAKHLKSKELDFIFASNGFEALKTLHRDPEINILLTDINMPEMDGLALLGHLPELKRIFKPIIISAYGDMSNIRKAMNRGACDFITKPIDFKDLEITIFNAIEQYLTLKKALEAQSQLGDIEKELVIARSIQQSIIPHDFKPFPDNNDFEIYGTMIPAKQVGGDFFDFFPLDNQRLGFFVGDVSGKGIPASLFMAMARAVLRAVAQRSSTPEQCLKETNKILGLDNETCMFVTAFYGIYNIKSGELECSNAGHLPPFILDADKHIKEIGRYQGISLGVAESSAYTNIKMTLNKGDCLILYTDGITEAFNVKRELYGENRLKEILKSWPGGPLPSLNKYILDKLNEFVDPTLATDDITILCLKRL